jgi:hypothetical protein
VTANEPDGFVQFTHDGDRGRLVAFSADGATTVDITVGEPCDCACWGLLADDVLYGPGLPREVIAASLRLDDDRDFTAGELSRFEHISERRPLSELA